MLKRIIKTAVVFTSSSVLALASANVLADEYDGMPPETGLYVGFMLGPTTSGAKSSSGSSSTSFGGRFLVGYDANPYFGYEAGLSTYPQKLNSSGCKDSSERKLYLDVLLKALLPVGGGAAVYTKAGAATGVSVPGLNSCNEGSNASKFYPAVSLGARTTFSNNYVADLSWNRLVFGGDIEFLDMYAIGFSYRFM